MMHAQPKTGFIGMSIAIIAMLAVLLLNSGVAHADCAGCNLSGALGTPVDEQALAERYAQVPHLRNMTNEERQAAAARAAMDRLALGRPILGAPGPGGMPDYFGMTPNYANSPSPAVDPITGQITGGIRKFKTALPGLGSAGANEIGQYLPVAVADTSTYLGSDYYEIALVEYTEQLHPDIPPTRLRGYVQLETPFNFGVSKHVALFYPDGTPILKYDGSQAIAVDNPHYLGPVIVATKDVPVRVKFMNLLPNTSSGGNLFIPVDPTIMGAGMGPLGMMASNYTENRGTLHLHGGNTPWISDGTMHQWTTPAEETTPYPEGISIYDVPDMDGGTEPAGTMTFYYTNQQSARLMFYHDHAYGITRLNVYAGEAAAYLVTDTAEGNLTASGIIPSEQIPIVIQDKAFVDAARIANQDPTWNWGTTPPIPHTGDLWFPHVYMPNQNPADISGANMMGRWDYGPWFWPPFTGLVNGPVPNPLAGTTPQEGPVNPGTPNPTIVPEAFVDTPIVNGNAYPYLQVGQKSYRLRILNAANDRYWNLQLYYASTAKPFVVISGGGGSGASAEAVVVNGSITNIILTSGGVGYTSAPNVTIFDAPGHTPAGSGSTANATVDLTMGMVSGITIASNGSGYSVPTICKGPGAPVPSLCTEVSMVPAVPGNWPAGWPTPDGRNGGWPDPNSIGPSMIEIGTEGGFLPVPAVIPNRPIGYNYNRRDITVLNVQEKALFLGPAERADAVVDFSQVPDGSTLILYNDAPAPVPAFDPRNDYYTYDPDQTPTGGAPTTLPGYGPNTRTVMQFQVNSSHGTAPAFNLTALQAALPAAYAQFQAPPIIPQASYNAAFNQTYPADAYVRIQDTNVTFYNGTVNVTMQLAPKTIQELFDPYYGRMNAQLGVEVPFTNINTQTTIPYFDTDPITELILNSNTSVPIGTTGDGTQIWKITHNGVDTHAIHWHMFNVQLINRVGWDGMVKPPDSNELGWKDTIRMNPLEDIIVALRPVVPSVPFNLTNSQRPMDVIMPPGTSMPDLLEFTGVDPTGQPAPVINHLINYGHEYMWHCHLLGHEENIMMRMMGVATEPAAPTSLNAVLLDPQNASLDWTDNAISETGFAVQRDVNTSGIYTTVATVPFSPGSGSVVTYIDTGLITGTTYTYQIVAINTVGDTTVYLAPTVGYPTLTANSTPSNTATVNP